MNIFKRIFFNVRESIVRFPVSLILGIVASVLFSVLLWKDGDNSTAIFSYAKPVCWTIVFSVFIQLCTERLIECHPVKNEKLVYLVIQCACIALCFFPIRFVFNNNDIFTVIAYFGTLFSLVLGIFFLLKYIHGEDLLEYSIAYSFAVAAVACWCICAGCSLIVFTVDKLIVKKDLDEKIYFTIFLVSFFVFAIQFFVAYLSKKDEFSIPRATYVIYFFILLPLYSILIVVLYVYLIQSLVLRNMPHMNWFVSIATALFIAFWFSFKPFENKMARLFYKFGAYILFPLVVIQWINFIERINAYGFTTFRVASLYYIIFSTAFLILSMIKCGKYNFHAIWGLAVIILIASVTPLNIKRLAVISQVAKIESIYKAHNLFKDGKLIAASNENEFSVEEKHQITESYNSFGLPYSNNLADEKKLVRLIGFLNVETVSNDDIFKNTFGFERHYFYDTNEYTKTWDFHSDITLIDVSEYSQMCEIQEVKYSDKEDKSFVVKSELGDYDITDFVNKNINDIDSYSVTRSHSPIYYEPCENIVICFTYIYCSINEKADMPYFNANGYVFKKEP